MVRTEPQELERLLPGGWTSGLALPPISFRREERSISDPGGGSGKLLEEGKGAIRRLLVDGGRGRVTGGSSLVPSTRGPQGIPNLASETGAGASESGGNAVEEAGLDSSRSLDEMELKMFDRKLMQRDRQRLKRQEQGNQ